MMRGLPLGREGGEYFASVRSSGLVEYFDPATHIMILLVPFIKWKMLLLKINVLFDALDRSVWQKYDFHAKRIFYNTAKVLKHAPYVIDALATYVVMEISKC